jgi:hypothetical protein
MLFLLLLGDVASFSTPPTVLAFFLFVYLASRNFPMEFTGSSLWQGKMTSKGEMGGAARVGGFLKVIPTVRRDFEQRGRWAVGRGWADF